MAATKTTPLMCRGHTRPVVHLSFSEIQADGGFLLASSCKDGNPMLRDWTGDWIGTFIGHKGAVWSTKLSKDASRAATGSADFTSKVWDTYSGAMLHSFSHNHIVRTVALEPSALHLLTAGNEKKMRLFDLNRTDAPPSFMKRGSNYEAHGGTIKSVVLQNDVAVSAGDDGMIRWWDFRSLSETHSLDMGDPITSMELSVQQSTLTVCAGKSVSFIPFSPGAAPAHTLPLLYTTSSASLHPTLRDRFVAGSTGDEWVHPHDLDGVEREVHKGHHGPVHCVEYSPDGEMFASGSEDGTIRLWQTFPGKSYGLWQGRPEFGNNSYRN